MAQYPLPKNLHPDFYGKGKPTGRVEIDWSNPLAKGLSTCLVWQNGTPIDLVTGKICTKGGDTKWTPSGQYFDESGDYLVLPDVTLNSNYTILAHPDFEDNSGTAFQFVFSYGAIRSANSLNLFLSESTQPSAPERMRLQAEHPGTGSSVDIANYWPSRDDKALAARGEGTDLSLYQDGEQIGSTTTYAAIANGTTKDFYIGTREDLDADRYFGGWLRYLFIFNDRALSVSEIAELQRDPYQILKPAVDMPFFVGVAGGGGGPTIYDVAATFGLSQGMTHAGGAQALGGIVLSNQVSCDDSGLGQYQASSTFNNQLAVTQSAVSQALATAALTQQMGYSTDGIIAFLVDVSFASTMGNTYQGTATGNGAISLGASLQQTVSGIAQTIASVLLNTSHDFQSFTGQSVSDSISLGVNAGISNLGTFTISGDITISQTLSDQINASAQANAQINLGAQIGLSVLAQAAAQAGITLNQVVSVVNTGTSLVFGITTPEGRVYTIEVDTRTLTIESENRTYTVN